MQSKRRTFLSHLAWAAAAPSLPAWAADAGSSVVPRRFLFFMTFHSNVYQNWVMHRPGLSNNQPWEFDLNPLAQADFSRTYAPLWELRSKILILDALSNAANLSDPNPQGHHGGEATILTSSRYDRGDLLDSGGGATQIRATAPSLDQILADKIGAPGKLRSLELGSHLIGVYGPIWRAAGRTLPLLTDPRKAYQRVFPSGDTLSARERQVAAAGPQVVAFTRDRYTRVGARLGRSDRERLEAHRDMLGDLQLRLRSGSASSAGSPRIGCPATAPALDGGSSLAQKVDDFGRIVAAAFACDLTRVASIQLDMMAPGDFGGPAVEVHNDICHHGSDPEKIRLMGTYYRAHGEHFASVLRHLDSIREIDGKTLLDHTIVLWAPECGGFEHQSAHLPLVLAGGGGFRMGRYLYWPSDPPNATKGDGSNYARIGPPHTRLLVSIARQFDLDVDQIGNISTSRGMSLRGPLDRLL